MGGAQQSLYLFELFRKPVLPLTQTFTLPFRRASPLLK